MKFKNYLFLFFLSVALCIGLAPLGSYGHHWKLLAASLLYFAVTCFFLGKTKSVMERWRVAALMAIPPLSMYLPIHIRDYENTLLGLPSFIAHFAGIAIAFITYASRGKWRYAFTVVLLVAAPVAAFRGYAFWLHKLNFGTYTGNVYYKAPAPISGVLQDHKPLKHEDLKGKVVLLDFWHTRCGVCFQKFPQVQKLYDQYKNNPLFILLAVNKPLETDSTEQAFAMLKQRNYSFPVLIPTVETLPEAFGVKAYPTTVVIDKTGSVVYKGCIENATEVIDQLLAVGM